MSKKKTRKKTNKVKPVSHIYEIKEKYRRGFEGNGETIE